MSIGAGGGLRGREAERERERREYEEGRLVRLPDEGGGKRKKGRAEGRGKVGGWDEVIGGGGGEGLGEAVRGGGVGKGKRRRGEGGGEGVGRRVGAMWEERKRRGVKGMGGKKRR